MAAFFILLFKPLRFVASFIFHKIIVKIYCYYLSFIRKFGWSFNKGNFFGFLFNQKLVHVVVVFLTIVIVFSNFFTSTKASASEKVRGTILANLVQGEFGDMEDSELIEEFYDEEAVNKIAQNTYVEEDFAGVSSQPQAVIDSMEEIKDDQSGAAITSGGAAIEKPEIASTKKSVKPRKEIVQYTVQGGDTISTIAANFNITVNTILWANNLNSYSLIRPGQTLSILPVSGVAHEVARGDTLSTIANKYDVTENEILSFNKLANANQLRIGENLIIPGGVKITYAPVKTASYSGVSAITSIVKSPSATPVSGNKMNWPTVGHTITQYYSWRHTGLDIANKIGTPIYAADSGTIEFVGWSNGYGNNIVINHGGGKKTRYAHLSKFYVKKGDQVDKGETIGAMGSTGWSTGPHLHFEVIINGKKYNPLNYIK